MFYKTTKPRATIILEPKKRLFLVIVHLYINGIPTNDKRFLLQETL